MGKEWIAIVETRDLRHVIPLNDAKDHETASYFGAERNLEGWPECDCHCNPKREWLPDRNAWLFIHSSFDGREGLEWTVEILNSK